MIRDQALAARGLLVERIGGPSVKPYQPAGLWNELTDADYVQDHGARSLSPRTFTRSGSAPSRPPPWLTFDAPGRETCIVRESRTNTPLQALDVLNDVTFVEAARGLGRADHQGARQRTPKLAHRAHSRLATARRPRHDELAVLTGGLPRPARPFPPRSDGGESTGECRRSDPRPALDHAELAAYTDHGQL